MKGNTNNIQLERFKSSLTSSNNHERKLSQNLDKTSATSLIMKMSKGFGLILKKA